MPGESVGVRSEDTSAKYTVGSRSEDYTQLGDILDAGPLITKHSPP